MRNAAAQCTAPKAASTQANTLYNLRVTKLELRVRWIGYASLSRSRRSNYLIMHNPGFELEEKILVFCVVFRLLDVLAGKALDRAEIPRRLA